jgi:hypothetical protein
MEPATRVVELLGESDPDLTQRLGDFPLGFSAAGKESNYTRFKNDLPAAITGDLSRAREYHEYFLNFCVG